jgi:hypothetical protein
MAGVASGEGAVEVGKGLGVAVCPQADPKKPKTNTQPKPKCLKCFGINLYSVFLGNYIFNSLSLKGRGYIFKLCQVQISKPLFQ